jgi:hypothetical protein
MGHIDVLTVGVYNVALSMNLTIYASRIESSVARSVALVFQDVSLFFAGVLVKKGDTFGYDHWGFGWFRSIGVSRVV